MSLTLLSMNVQGMYSNECIANIALKIDNTDNKFLISLRLQTFLRGWFVDYNITEY